jgi:hypothetical protein
VNLVLYCERCGRPADAPKRPEDEVLCGRCRRGKSNEPVKRPRKEAKECEHDLGR